MLFSYYLYSMTIQSNVKMANYLNVHQCHIQTIELSYSKLSLSVLVWFRFAMYHNAPKELL